MEKSSRESKQDIITSIDTRIPSPKERAERVFAILRATQPDLTNWDLLCFAAEYLGMTSQDSMPALEKPAHEACTLVYTAHYMLFEQTFNDAHNILPIGASGGFNSRNGTNGTRPESRGSTSGNTREQSFERNATKKDGAGDL